MTLTPAQIWWSAEQIAVSGLPDVPSTQRGVRAFAERNDWQSQPALARRRSGKGGGWEYSWKLFPSAAQRKLLQGAAAPAQAARPERDEVWVWYEALPQTVKNKAQARLLILQKVEALEAAVGRHLAVVQVSDIEGVGARTIWTWFAMVEGVAGHDRLAYLAPRNRAQEKRARSKDCDPEFFAFLRSDYLRLEAPPFTDCYRRSARVAKSKGWDILPERTMIPK